MAKVVIGVGSAQADGRGGGRGCRGQGARPSRVCEHGGGLWGAAGVLAAVATADVGDRGMQRHRQASGQRLGAEHEMVVDVSTRRCALVGVYAGGNGRKTDDIDAHSIAMVGLQTPDLPVVRPDDRPVTLRLLAHRRHELVGLRTQAVCRLHRDLANLIPGGARRALTARKAREVLAKIRPRDEVGRWRRQLAADQLAGLVAIDRRLAYTTSSWARHPPGWCASSESVRSRQPGSWAKSATSPGSGLVTTSPVTTAPAPTTQAAAVCLCNASTSRATARSTTRSTWSPSPRSATTHPAAPTTSANKPRARPKRKPSELSRAGFPTRSTDSSSKTRDSIWVREGKRGRLSNPA